MKPEEIKIGGVYDVRVKVIKKLPAPTPAQIEIGAYTVDRATNLPMEYEMTWFLTEESSAFAEITPKNGVKNSDPAPKYDPCRFFREGDIVEPKTVNGRIFNGAVEELIGKNCVVVEDELECCNVRIRHGEDEYTIDPAYLELVTPVEELNPYCIADHIHGWIVYKDNPGNVVANFNKTHPNPKEAAEAECARLNAEIRKEQTEQ